MDDMPTGKSAVVVSQYINRSLRKYRAVAENGGWRGENLKKDW